MRSRTHLRNGLFRCQKNLAGRPGMTLLEITVVILVLLTLITVLFVGTQAWRRGSDRAICIIHIQTVQKGIRSFANFHSLEEGAQVPDLFNQIIGPGKYVESEPECPSRGTYRFGLISGINNIPAVGELYTECSLKGSHEHEPPDHSDW
ncbi:MAG: hypothetical protein EOP85_11300 [Verrucomicrobiaceae bacterium]|nr:MAG: hypothetical protein EOP85_11300 [Verrucomicrobiaceae bacterium]